MFRTLHKHPLIKLKNSHSDTVLLILALVMTALNGVSIDLFTPSLPAIANAFGVSAVAAKASISIGLLGFGVGVFALGVTSDRLGRRRMTLIGLALFVLASITATLSTHYDLFMASRFFQGAGVATAAMLSRAMILDHFTGKKLYSAMLYTTIAWGLGPVIAPFIGGYFQHYFGWQMNFVFYSVYGIATLVAVTLLLPETLKPENQHHGHYLQRIAFVFNHTQFLIYASICALAFTQYVLYSLLGPFIVEKALGYNAVVFGHTALLTGAGYFSGALSSRFLQRYFNPRQCITIGLCIIFVADLIFFAISALSTLSLWSLVLPMIFMIYGVGMLFSNAIGKTLEPFKTHAGAAVSMHGAMVILLGGLFTTIIGQLNTHSIVSIASIIGVSLLGQVALMLISRRVQTTSLIFNSEKQRGPITY